MATKRELKTLFLDRLETEANYLKWIADAPTDAIMVSRIGVLSHWTKAFIFGSIMPSGLRDKLNNKFPGRMEVPSARQRQSNRK